VRDVSRSTYTRASLSITCLSCVSGCAARECAAAGFLLRARAHGIVLWRGEIAQPVRHAQHKEDEGRAADRGALRRDGRGDAPPPPGVTDVAAELAQGMPYGEWHYDG